MQSVLHQVIVPEEVHPENLDGKIAIVAGSATGIGYEVSRALAHAGVRVIMVNRSEEKGDEAIERSKKKLRALKLNWKGCDLGSLAEVRKVFSQLRDDLDRLDYLVLLAGINANKYGTDADEIDHHFGVNYLGHDYAINQLWPLLRKTIKVSGASAPRIVFESSEIHRLAPYNVHFASLDEINNPTIDPTQLYARTKLAMILGTK